jgi:hypothetical protein
LNQLLNKSLTESSTSTQTSVTPISVSKINITQNNPVPVTSSVVPTAQNTIPYYWYVVGDWGSCTTNGTQTRTVTKEVELVAVLPQGGSEPEPAAVQSCCDHQCHGWNIFGWCTFGEWACN